MDCQQCLGSGVMRGDSCDLCHGAGYQPCVEPRCDVPAVGAHHEAGRKYPLCTRHLVEWQEAADS